MLQAFHKIGLLFFFLTTLMVTPTIAQMQMDNEQIEEIARHVVLILALEDGEPVSSGSGTIVSSDGLIYTNRHVVEDADDYAIYVLNDINEQPELTYFASVDSMFGAMDFAVLQINRDADGNALLRTNIDIPFLEVSEPASLQRGDEIFVFGYPGVGEDFLVLTNGLISSVQNDEIGGERLPARYGTDAEISPGNSGGLAVTTEGVPVGIPTAVFAEGQTGGRLGIILPFSAVFALIESGTGLVVDGSNQGGSNPPTGSGDPGTPPDTGVPSGGPTGITVNCDNGVTFNNGVEVTVVQMRTGFTYRATALGMNGFDPVLAVLDANGNGLCTDDSADAVPYTANLPTTGQVSSSGLNSQVRFSNNGGSAFADVSLVVGGYGDQSGEFVLILEGMAATAADGAGDPFSVRITPGMVASGVPLTVYMISDTNGFDPGMALVDSNLNILTDNSGARIYCDDAGTTLCYGNSVPLSGYYVSANGGRQLPGFQYDAMLSFDLSPELVDAYFNYLATNSPGVINQGTNTYGDYTMVFHIGIGQP